MCIQQGIHLFLRLKFMPKHKAYVWEIRSCITAVYSLSASLKNSSMASVPRLSSWLYTAFNIYSVPKSWWGRPRSFLGMYHSMPSDNYTQNFGVNEIIKSPSKMSDCNDLQISWSFWFRNMLGTIKTQHALTQWNLLCPLLASICYHSYMRCYHPEYFRLCLHGWASWEAMASSVASTQLESLTIWESSVNNAEHRSSSCRLCTVLCSFSKSWLPGLAWLFQRSSGQATPYMYI